MSLQNKKIGFIGGGNMAEALVSGLLASKQARAANIYVAEPLAARRNQLSKRYRVKTLAANQELMKKCSLIVLAVKPQVMAAVLQGIRPGLNSKHLLISIAAGIDTRFMQRHLGRSARLMRTMPNTPALVRKGITALFAAKTARPIDIKNTHALFSSVGEVIVCKREDQLDWVTALSGSGPAYVFLFLESLVNAAVKGGLAETQARQLATATLTGATELAASQKTALKTLRERVTSKGGTTAAALNTLKKARWPQALERAVKAAAARAKQLRGK